MTLHHSRHFRLVALLAFSSLSLACLNLAERTRCNSDGDCLNAFRCVEGNCTDVEGSPEGEPNVAPEGEPSVAPEGEPSVAPEGEPSVAPEGEPSVAPEGEPSVAPEGEPSVAPEGEPSPTPEVVIPAPESGMVVHSAMVEGTEIMSWGQATVVFRVQSKVRPRTNVRLTIEEPGQSPAPFQLTDAEVVEVESATFLDLYDVTVRISFDPSFPTGSYHFSQFSFVDEDGVESSDNLATQFVVNFSLAPIQPPPAEGVRVVATEIQNDDIIDVGFFVVSFRVQSLEPPTPTLQYTTMLPGGQIETLTADVLVQPIELENYPSSYEVYFVKALSWSDNVEPGTHRFFDFIFFDENEVGSVDDLGTDASVEFLRSPPIPAPVNGMFVWTSDFDNEDIYGEGTTHVYFRVQSNVRPSSMVEFDHLLPDGQRLTQEAEIVSINALTDPIRENVWGINVDLPFSQDAQSGIHTFSDFVFFDELLQRSDDNLQTAFSVRQISYSEFTAPVVRSVEFGDLEVERWESSTLYVRVGYDPSYPVGMTLQADVNGTPTTLTATTFYEDGTLVVPWPSVELSGDYHPQTIVSNVVVTDTRNQWSAIPGGPAMLTTRDGPTPPKYVPDEISDQIFLSQTLETGGTVVSSSPIIPEVHFFELRPDGTQVDHVIPAEVTALVDEDTYAVSYTRHFDVPGEYLSTVPHVFIEDGHRSFELPFIRSLQVNPDPAPTVEDFFWIDASAPTPEPIDTAPTEVPLALRLLVFSSAPPDEEILARIGGSSYPGATLRPLQCETVGVQFQFEWTLDCTVSTDDSFSETLFVDMPSVSATTVEDNPQTLTGPSATGFKLITRSAPQTVIPFATQLSVETGLSTTFGRINTLSMRIETEGLLNLETFVSVFDGVQYVAIPASFRQLVSAGDNAWNVKLDFVLNSGGNAQILSGVSLSDDRMSGFNNHLTAIPLSIED